MHANGFGLALSVLLVSPGCSCGDDDGGGGGAADGGGSADSGGEVDGGGGIGLIVHVGYLTEGSTTWVVLGDGEEYQKLESTTDAVFPDARLPQDVHHVQVGLEGNLPVRSYLAIDAHEIWLEGAGDYSESYERQLSGTVNTDLESGTWVAAGGDGVNGLRGSTSAGVGGGGYAITLSGYSVGTVDVVAYQSGGEGPAVRAGAVRGIDLSADAPVTGVDI